MVASDATDSTISQRTSGIAPPSARAGQGRRHDMGGASRNADASTIRAVSRLSETLRSALDLTTLMDGIVGEAVLMVNAERGCSGLCGERRMALYGDWRKSKRQEWSSFPLGDGTLEFLLTHKKPYLTNDPRRDSLVDGDRCAELGIRNAVCIPLFDAKDDVIGFVGLFNKTSDTRFTQADQEKLIALSQAVATTVQNALAYKRLKQTEHRHRSEVGWLQLLARQIVELQERERQALARELHDDVCQALTAIKLNLQVATTNDVGSAELAEHVEESLGILENVLDEVRNLSLDLRPVMLDNGGLESTLRRYVNRWAQRAGLEARFNIDQITTSLPRKTMIACYRIVQGAIANVVRHANASRVSVKLRAGHKGLRLSVRDDGVGFDTVAAKEGAAQGRSLGLSGMREDALLAGGYLQVRSRRGRGTEIRARFPWREATRNAQR